MYYVSSSMVVKISGEKNYTQANFFMDSRWGLFNRLISPKFRNVPLGLGGDGLWATKSEGVGLIVCAISFQDSNLCDPDPPTSQTDDMQSQYRALLVI